MNLLLRPHRHEDESLRGFVWRLAQANGIPSPITMYERIFRKRAGLPSLAMEIHRKYQSISTASNSAPIQYPACSENFILKSTFRICAHCFDEKRYLRTIWDYALLPICLTHRCALIDVKDVGKLWAINGTHYFGKPVVGTEGQETIALISYLQIRLGFTSRAINEDFSAFDQLSVNDFQRLIFLVGSFEICSDLAKPRKAPVKSNIDTTIQIFRHAAKTLIDWPLNIRNILLSGRLLQIESRKLFREYGAIHRALKRELVGKQYDFVKQDYEYFLLANWPDVIDKKSTWFCDEVKTESNFITGTEFSKSVGVRLNKVVDWIERGLIEGNVRYLRINYRQITLKKEQENHLREIQDLMTLKDLCNYLGMTKKAVRSLLEDGLIDSLRKGRGNIWAIQKSEVLHFLNRLKSSSLGDAPTTYHKSLTHLRRFCSNRAGIRLADIFKQMLELRVDYIYAPAVSNRLTDSIFIEVSEYKMCTCNNTLISIQDLAVQLSVKQEVAYHLINTRLIPSIDKGRAGRFVTRKSIDAFLNDYTFLNDIAKSLNTSSKYLVEEVIKENFSFISGPTVDSGRQYILRKTDANLVLDLYRSM